MFQDRVLVRIFCSLSLVSAILMTTETKAQVFALTDCGGASVTITSSGNQLQLAYKGIASSECSEVKVTSSNGSNKTYQLNGGTGSITLAQNLGTNVNLTFASNGFDKETIRADEITAGSTSGTSTTGGSFSPPPPPVDPVDHKKAQELAKKWIQDFLGNNDKGLKNFPTVCSNKIKADSFISAMGGSPQQFYSITDKYAYLTTLVREADEYKKTMIYDPPSGGSYPTSGDRLSNAKEQEIRGSLNLLAKTSIQEDGAAATLPSYEKSTIFKNIQTICKPSETDAYGSARQFESDLINSYPFDYETKKFLGEVISNGNSTSINSEFDKYFQVFSNSTAFDSFLAQKYSFEGANAQTGEEAKSIARTQIASAYKERLDSIHSSCSRNSDSSKYEGKRVAVKFLNDASEKISKVDRSRYLSCLGEGKKIHTEVESELRTIVTRVPDLAQRNVSAAIATFPASCDSAYAIQGASSVFSSNPHQSTQFTLGEKKMFNSIPAVQMSASEDFAKKTTGDFYRSVYASARQNKTDKSLPSEISATEIKKCEHLVLDENALKIDYKNQFLSNQSTEIQKSFSTPSVQTGLPGSSFSDPKYKEMALIASKQLSTSESGKSLAADLMAQLYPLALAKKEAILHAECTKRAEASPVISEAQKIMDAYAFYLGQTYAKAKELCQAKVKSEWKTYYAECQKPKPVKVIGKALDGGSGPKSDLSLAIQVNNTQCVDVASLTLFRKDAGELIALPNGAKLSGVKALSEGTAVIPNAAKMPEVPENFTKDKTITFNFELVTKDKKGNEVGRSTFSANKSLKYTEEDHMQRLGMLDMTDDLGEFSCGFDSSRGVAASKLSYQQQLYCKEYNYVYHALVSDLDACAADMDSIENVVQCMNMQSGAFRGLISSIDNGNVDYEIVVSEINDNHDEFKIRKVIQEAVKNK